MRAFRIRLLLSVFCLALLVVPGCGLLGEEALESPDEFDRLVSLPLPGGWRVTVYRGADSRQGTDDTGRTGPEGTALLEYARDLFATLSRDQERTSDEAYVPTSTGRQPGEPTERPPVQAMSIFTDLALTKGWHLLGTEGDIRSIDVLGFFLSVVPLEKGERMQLLGFTDSSDAALVVSVIGPSDRVSEYLELVPSGDVHLALPPSLVSWGDGESAEEHRATLPGSQRDDQPVEEPDSEAVLQIRGAVTLVERFSLFEFVADGTRIRYEYVGIEKRDGEDVYRVRFIWDQAKLDFWLDMHGYTVDLRVDGEASAGHDVRAKGDRHLIRMFTFFDSGLQDLAVKVFTAEVEGEEGELIIEGAAEHRQFGPTSAAVVQRVVRQPGTDETMEMEYADLGEMMPLTRFVLEGEERFVVTKFAQH